MNRRQNYVLGVRIAIIFIADWGESTARPNMSHPAKPAITRLTMSLSALFGERIP
jgi:hypothetical protein